MNPPIQTVGVYLKVGSRFAFAFGPNRHKGKLGIARFGGHLEAGETFIECARREVKEETTLEADILPSPVTFDVETSDGQFMEYQEEGVDLKPIFRIGQNVMYSARSDHEPKLSSETKGIILLTESELLEVCSREVSYGEFLAWGGQRIVSQEYPESFILQPLIQMRLLARLLQEKNDILNDPDARQRRRFNNG